MFLENIAHKEQLSLKGQKIYVIHMGFTLSLLRRKPSYITAMTKDFLGP